MADKPMQISSAAASHFADDKRAFESLIDALATSDPTAAIKAAVAGGFSREEASRITESSSALASAMNSIGDMMAW